jgi:rSAM/selenodomain-associated transferase 1
MSASGSAPGTGAARRVVIVFARLPQLGKVKTRLAAALGDSAALAIYRELLDDTLKRVDACPGIERRLCVTGDDPGGLAEALATLRGYRLMRQGDGDLGARMAQALREALDDGARALLLGCDCPGIDAGVLDEAFDALDAHDMVFVPTEDGGYAMVGARIDHPGAFAGIDWGTAGVMSQTRARLCEHAIRWRELATLWDVDEPQDWARLLRERGAR